MAVHRTRIKTVRPHFPSVSRAHQVKPLEGQVELISDLPDHAKSSRKKAVSNLHEADRFVVVSPHIVYVQRNEDLRECVRAIWNSGTATIDTETRGLKWFQGKKAVSLNIYTPNNGRAYFIPVRMVHAVRNFTDAEIQQYFEEVFADSDIRFIGHNFTFDRHFMRETFNIEVKNFWHDTMLASRILDENVPHTLDDLCTRYLHAKSWKRSHDAAFEIWPIKVATQYAGMDATWTWKLYEFQRKHLRRLPKLEELFYTWEMPTARKAYQMEHTGICYDQKYHEEEMKPYITHMAENARAAVYEHTGKINLEQPAEIANALFEMLGLPRINENHVDEAVLSELKKQHEVCGSILEYRKYSTLNKMFVSKLLTHVTNGRIHGTFNTLGAKTGRMSMNEPNLQQLPKRVGPTVRRAIVPSPGCVFVTMDYSQIELRMLAHFSGEPVLIDAFASGKDIHAAVMCSMLGVSEEEYKANPDKPEFVAKRVLAKTVNFGVLYGMGQTKLAWKTGVSKEEAQHFIDQYFEQLPFVDKWIKSMKVQAYKHGFVETILGRKRRLPDAQSIDRMKSSMAEREAVNSPIQGSVADLMKMAALKHEQIIIKNSWPYDLLLQIHDELLYEIPEDWLLHNHHSLDVLQHEMAHVYPLRLPVEVNVEVLSRWGDKTELEWEEDEAI
jgi:DNA polymerase-1